MNSARNRFTCALISNLSRAVPIAAGIAWFLWWTAAPQLFLRLQVHKGLPQCWRPLMKLEHDPQCCLGCTVRRSFGQAGSHLFGRPSKCKRPRMAAPANDCTADGLGPQHNNPRNKATRNPRTFDCCSKAGLFQFLRGSSFRCTSKCHGETSRAVQPVPSHGATTTSVTTPPTSEPSWNPKGTASNCPQQ